MPVILSPEDHGRWLDPVAEPHELEPLLRPAADDLLTRYEVGREVNNARTDEPQCVRPLENGGRERLLFPLD